MNGVIHLMKTMKKLLLVDGNSMLFRAYYATAYGRRMTSNSGVPTNAIFGFANMFQKALSLANPDAVLVAFDAGKHTFRHDIYKDYKGTRKPAPDDLVPQFQLVRDYLDAYNICWVEKEDIEADDLIGTMSRKTPEFETTILTSDRDLLQLIDEHTKVMLMKKGISEMEEMTVSSLYEEMGITPSQVIDMKALMGDTADNIPGIKGIGEKTAKKLLDQYGTVENVLEHDTELKGAMGKKVQAGHEMAMISKDLATIRTDITLDIDVEECAYHPNYETLMAYFESLDMYSLAKKCEPFVMNDLEETVVSKFESEIVTKMDPSFLQDGLAIFVEDDGEQFLDAKLLGISLSNGNKSYYMVASDVKKDDALLAYFKDDQKKIGFDVKRNYHVLKHAGIEINFSDDAMIIGALCDSTMTSQEKIFVGFDCNFTRLHDDVFGTKGRPKLVDMDEEALYCNEFSANIHKVYTEGIVKIKEYGMHDLYAKMEFPLSKILFEMEEIGIECKEDTLQVIADEMKEQLDGLEKEIMQYSNEEFNVNSPKQLAVVLFDELGLPSGKKRSTSADVLTKLKGTHPIIEPILEYRRVNKIYSTYADGLQKYISKDGRIHTLYNQVATTTGRLSSSEPNLQNISVRDEQGKLIRKAFVPSDDHVLVSCDYHQIELRMLADMADADALIETFKEGVDVHTKTAMDIFDVSKEEVTPLMRRRAKAVNFGVVYGISEFGLAEQLNCSRFEARDFIAKYYKKYPKIKEYMDHVVKFCEENGYVETICHRRRDIPEIHAKSYMMREFGKRAAMNAPIQGSAADLIKIAMIEIDRKMKEQGVKSKMILQVHDELIFDVYNDELDLMKDLIEDGMVHAMELKVPLTVELTTGKTWYEAK